MPKTSVGILHSLNSPNPPDQISLVTVDTVSAKILGGLGFDPWPGNVQKLIWCCLNMASKTWIAGKQEISCWAYGAILLAYIFTHLFFLHPLCHLIRSCREELQARGREPDPEHHHGPEGPHEDQREEQARDLWADPGSVRPWQNNTRHSNETDQAERARWDV